MTLFRPEAIQASERRIEGEVNLAVPLTTSTVTMILAVFVAVAVAAACVVPYGRRELVSGVITPQSGMSRLVSPSTGRVDRLLVSEGQVVRRGQALMEIAASESILTSSSQAAEMATLAGAALDREQEAVRRRSQAEHQTLLAEQARLTALLTAQQGRLVAGRRRADGRRQALALATRDLARIEQLAENGFAPERERAVRTTTVIQAQADLDDAESDLVTLGGEMEQTRSLLEAGRQSELRRQAELDGAAAQYEQQRAEVQARNRWALSSPINGRVVALSASPGEPVDSSRVLAIVVPGDGRLEAELQVPVRSIGMLRVGQAVRLQYDAFPHQRFGAGDGVLTSISGAPVTPAAGLPGQSVEPLYRVRASLRTPEISVYGQRSNVQAGMTLRASIVTGRRTLLQWLTDPIRDAGRRS
ncbi:MAG: HlyD family secretion protein [Brevundimonas sp.]|uniref:HlyD family secretion protein n=1 Tax=Brevundimonas sp. TaxID=1871086 RepID=UPI003918C132